jgi:hypothetical protein
VVHRDDMKIAAKTGTAQVGSATHRRQIAWLSGYLPADNPQYAFSFMVEGTFADNRNDTLEGGLLGGVDAGQIAKGVFDVIYPVPGKKGDSKDTPAPSAAAADDSTTTIPSKDDSTAPSTNAPPADNATAAAVPAPGDLGTNDPAATPPDATPAAPKDDGTVTVPEKDDTAPTPTATTNAPAMTQ